MFFGINSNPQCLFDAHFSIWFSQVFFIDFGLLSSFTYSFCFPDLCFLRLSFFILDIVFSLSHFPAIDFSFPPWWQILQAFYWDKEILQNLLSLWWAFKTVYFIYCTFSQPNFLGREVKRQFIWNGSKNTILIWKCLATVISGIMSYIPKFIVQLLQKCGYSNYSLGCRTKQNSNYIKKGVYCLVFSTLEIGWFGICCLILSLALMFSQEWLLATNIGWVKWWKSFVI